MTRVVRLTNGVLPEGTVLVEVDARASDALTQHLAQLPEEERAMAQAYQSKPRRDGFVAGRIALHAALAASEHAPNAASPVLRDARGRPLASWTNPPAMSIAHSRARAIAAVAPSGSCAAIGIDVEEIEASRAQALVRMSLSADECELVRAMDAELIVGPIAVWCARESCVKAHGFEVGWFGTALKLQAFNETPPRVEAAERAWDVVIAFETQADLRAHAWQSCGAIYAAVTRRT